jgi:hypothetical protein
MIFSAMYNQKDQIQIEKPLPHKFGERKNNLTMKDTLNFSLGLTKIYIAHNTLLIRKVAEGSFRKMKLYFLSVVI